MNKDDYQYTNEYVFIKIHKPLYGSYVYIREKHILYTQSRGIPLKIEIPQGTFIVKVEDFLKNSQKITKVFLHPDNPMVLYGNNVIPVPAEKKRQEQLLQQSLF